MLNEHPGIAGLLRHLAAVGDAALVDALKELLTRDGKLTAHIVAHIAEVDSRRLYANAAFQSMHVYCVEALHMSDAEAYLRIHAGRAARAYPILLEMLADRQLHLTAIGKLVPFLTPDNHLDLLRAAIHKTKRQVEELIAARFARPDVPEQIRKVPAPSRQPGAAGGVPAGVTGPQAPPAGATAADASPGEPPRPALATVPTSAATVPSSPASAPAPAARPTLPPEPRRDLVEPLSAAAYKVRLATNPLGACRRRTGARSPRGMVTSARSSTSRPVAVARRALTSSSITSSRTPSEAQAWHRTGGCSARSTIASRQSRPSVAPSWSARSPWRAPALGASSRLAHAAGEDLHRSRSR